MMTILTKKSWPIEVENSGELLKPLKGTFLSVRPSLADRSEPKAEKQLRRHNWNNSHSTLNRHLNGGFVRRKGLKGGERSGARLLITGPTALSGVITGLSEGEEKKN